MNKKYSVTTKGEAINIKTIKIPDGKYAAKPDCLPIYMEGNTRIEAVESLRSYLFELVPMLYERQDQLAETQKSPLETLLEHFDVKEES